MIAYKVIHKKTRYGSNAAGYIAEFGEHDFYNCVEALSLKKFFPVYRKDTIVEQAPKSVGLMAFESFDKAKHFTQDYSITAKIVKVEGTPKRKQPKVITQGCMNILALVYSKGNLTPAPTGTVFFTKLKVLE